MKVYSFDKNEVEKWNEFERQFKDVLAPPEESEKMIKLLEASFEEVVPIHIDVEPDVVIKTFNSKHFKDINL